MGRTEEKRAAIEICCCARVISAVIRIGIRSSTGG